LGESEAVRLSAQACRHKKNVSENRLLANCGNSMAAARTGKAVEIDQYPVPEASMQLYETKKL
jgi:selenophosphate synthetase-related protein